MNRMLFILVCAALTGFGCIAPKPGGNFTEQDPPLDNSTIEAQGTVVHNKLEGGFFGIRGDDGQNYLPLGLDDPFLKDGLRVQFEARKENMMTLQQWGTPVRLVTISVIAPADPTYVIEGKRIRLDKPGPDGTASLLASESGDLDNDGRNDRVAVLVLNSPGSGVFYHLNVFVDGGDGGWRLVGEEYLGDRIKFDYLKIYAEGTVSPVTGVPIHTDDFGKLAAAYWERSTDQAFSEDPILYLSKHWRVLGDRLVLIENY